MLPGYLPREGRVRSNGRQVTRPSAASNVSLYGGLDEPLCSMNEVDVAA